MSARSAAGNLAPSHQSTAAYSEPRFPETIRIGQRIYCVNEFVPTKIVSQLIGISVATIQNQRVLKTSIVIPFMKLPGKRGAVRYRLLDVLSWLARNQRCSTSE